jgi:hypothetical protein
VSLRTTRFDAAVWLSLRHHGWHQHSSTKLQSKISSADFLLSSNPRNSNHTLMSPSQIPIPPPIHISNHSQRTLNHKRPNSQHQYYPILNHCQTHKGFKSKAFFSPSTVFTDSLSINPPIQRSTFGKPLVTQSTSSVQKY